MRASQGVPTGRKIRLYHPELFNEYEEVIIYPQREFKSNFMAIKDHVNYSFLENYRFEMSEEWRMTGYWLAILERVQMIEIGMNQFFNARSSQSYLDAYIFDESSDEVMIRAGEVEVREDNEVKALDEIIRSSEISEPLINSHTNPLGLDWI